MRTLSESDINLIIKNLRNRILEEPRLDSALTSLYLRMCAKQEHESFRELERRIRGLTYCIGYGEGPPCGPSAQSSGSTCSKCGGMILSRAAIDQSKALADRLRTT
jgi:hypothetical protein